MCVILMCCLGWLPMSPPPLMVQVPMAAELTAQVNAGGLIAERGAARRLFAGGLF